MLRRLAPLAAAVLLVASTLPLPTRAAEPAPEGAAASTDWKARAEARLKRRQIGWAIAGTASGVPLGVASGVFLGATLQARDDEWGFIPALAAGGFVCGFSAAVPGSVSAIAAFGDARRVVREAPDPAAAAAALRLRARGPGIAAFALLGAAGGLSIAVTAGAFEDPEPALVAAAAVFVAHFAFGHAALATLSAAGDVRREASTARRPAVPGFQPHLLAASPFGLTLAW